jgi:hypothetical protein
LLWQGISHEIIFSYEDGWDFDRLLSLFYFLKKAQVQDSRNMTSAVAIGASSVMKGKVLNQFMKKNDEAVKKIDKIRKQVKLNDGRDTRVSKFKKDLSTLRGLRGFLGGGGMRRG